MRAATRRAEGRPVSGSARESWLARVRGRVQGVGFRQSCAWEAESLGVTGWVRNRADGSVEALLQGTPQQLARMREWLGRGPPMASVKELTISPAPADVPSFDTFELRHSE
jgi:acylphosphatase